MNSDLVRAVQLASESTLTTFLQHDFLYGFHKDEKIFHFIGDYRASSWRKQQEPKTVPKLLNIQRFFIHSAAGGVIDFCCDQIKSPFKSCTIILLLLCNICDQNPSNVRPNELQYFIFIILYRNYYSFVILAWATFATLLHYYFIGSLLPNAQHLGWIRAYYSDDFQS